MNMTILIYMNIYITPDNEKWLRMQGSSMSGIVNKFLTNARHGKYGPHVVAQYDTLAEATRSDLVRPQVLEQEQGPIPAKKQTFDKLKSNLDVRYAAPEDAA